MGDIFVVPIFHHGGQFFRNPLGELEYVNKVVERFPDMDVDHVNFGDMEKLFFSLGYREYRDVFWLDKNAPEFETGLNRMRGDASIPIVVEDDGVVQAGNEGGVNGGNDDANVGGNGAGGAAVPKPVNVDDTSSSSDDGYESAEDEAYKPPPSWTLDSDSDSESNGCDRKRSPRPKKKLKGKKVMEDKKKQSGMPSCKGSGGASSSKGTPQDTSDFESDEQGGNWSRPKPKVYMPQFLPSDDDYADEYEEENLRTSVSSEDEYQKPDWPAFDDEYEFGQGTLS
ncbi:hypothetical protein PIB30_104463 [Stylosanthes scabra]|uniref:PB1-like domain-containing protein n=1 Tax=Stylosanthes scabra TaxID=79078 RepID=A0ABU6UX69_9FABA|nr:hypothetical protein [Stylosanthes scabra]